MRSVGVYAIQGNSAFFFPFPLAKKKKKWSIFLLLICVMNMGNRLNQPKKTSSSTNSNSFCQNDSVRGAPRLRTKKNQGPGENFV